LQRATFSDFFVIIISVETLYARWRSVGGCVGDMHEFVSCAHCIMTHRSTPLALLICQIAARSSRLLIKYLFGLSPPLALINAARRRRRRRGPLSQYIIMKVRTRRASSGRLISGCNRHYWRVLYALMYIYTQHLLARLL
jgi:hypothetical protein